MTLPFDKAQGRPPRVPRAIVRLSAPPQDRAAIVGDLDEEFHQHHSTAEYWRQALASLPSVLRLRWQRAALVADLPRDVGFSLRLIRRYPGFAAAAIATVAVGAGVASAVASSVEAILLRPLPYVNDDRIDVLQEWDMAGTGSGSRVSWADYVELSARLRSFEAIAVFDGASRTLTGRGAAERLAAVEVSPRFFDVLGVAPAAGRSFMAADAVEGSERVVILADGAWRRLFNRDRSAIGQSIVLSGVPHTIVGALPRSFIFPSRGGAELWLPFRPSKAHLERPYFHSLDLIALRRAGITRESAAQELAGVVAEWAKRDAWHASSGLRAFPLHDDVVAGVRPSLQVLAGAALLLLIAASANVAGLILSRAAGRGREFDVRAALGATRFRLLRQLAVESACLAAAGSLCGLLLGAWVMATFAAAVPARYRLRLPYADRLALSPRAAALTIAFTCVVVVLASVAPAWLRGRRRSLVSGGGRTTSGRAEMRLRWLLVASQIALSVVLLAGALLITRSVLKLGQVSPGFDAHGLVTARLTLSGARYSAPDAVAPAVDRLLERIRALPGVSAAEAIDQAALTGSGNNGAFAVVGRPPAARRLPALIRNVTSGYFAVTRVPLVEGRLFSAADTASSPKVVVVNATLARRYFGRSAIGQRIVFQFFEGQPPWTIVGVVGDEQFNDLDKPVNPVVYFPFAQASSGSFDLVVRTALGAGVRDSLRSAVASIDPDLPVYGMRTMDALVAESDPLLLRAIVMRLLAWFALAALLLGGVGVYSVLAEAMASRTREIGVRMALGATRAGIGRFVLRSGFMPAIAGLAAGCVLTAVSVPALRSLLFGVSLLDLPTLAVVVVLLAGVTFAACAVPARRAMRMPVTTALRVD